MRCLFALLLLLVAGCPKLPPPVECATYKDCASCAAHYCGWCDADTKVKFIGCYSLQEPRTCKPAIEYVPYCTADPTDPATYQLKREDGGAR